MSSELATRPSLPGQLREDGYDLPPNLPFERWMEIGETLQQMEWSVQWWLGDWWNYGERHYSEMASQAAKDHVEDITGYAYQTVMNAATVAKKFEPSRRRENLSWSHHEAVKALPIQDAELLLDRVAAKGLNVFATRDAVRERKEQLRGLAVTASGEPVCLPSARWMPQLTDLTDEARDALLADAPKGRHQLGWISGFLAALVYVGHKEAFLEWKGP